MPRQAGLKRDRRYSASAWLGLVLTGIMSSMLWSGAATAAEVLPMNSAENAKPLAAGSVAPGPDGSVSLDDLLAALRADAAARRPGAVAGPPQVQNVTWPDGSLGCPQPGRMYTQALVPGYLIVFSDRDSTLRYHASARGGWVLCPAALATPPAPDGRLR